jgi:uncharacterized phiE125 gp8 family phage protein
MTCRDWNHPSRIQRSDNATRTEAECEPVTIAEVKNDVRVDFPDDDGIIDDSIQAARQYIEEQLLWKALITQTCIDKFNCFGGQFELAWQPVQSITSVEYVDGNGDSQTLSTDVYELANRNGAGIVRLKESQVWPVAQFHEDVVTITYVAGFGDDPSDVPISIRKAIRVLAGAWYLTPDGSMGVPLQVDSLLSGQSAARPLA